MGTVPLRRGGSLHGLHDAVHRHSGAEGKRHAQGLCLYVKCHYVVIYKIKRGTNHRHKKHRQTGDTTLKKGGSQLNYLDLTQTMAR